MRLITFVLLTLFAAVMLTLAAIEDPGYVLIARAPWSIEMPFTLFIPALVALFFTLAIVIFAIVRMARIPSDVAQWRMRRRVRRARAALLRGLINLTEGHHAEAETELLAGLRYSEAPLMNHLAAAFSAQEQGTLEKRDEHLAAAQRAAPDNALAVGMMQAWLQHRAHQNEQALATLADLRHAYPRHRHLLRLLAQVYQELHDWTGLVDLIVELRNQGAMPHTEIDALELRAHRELLQLSLPSGSHEVLVRAWEAVPKPLRGHPTLVAIYARQLIRQNQMQEAETVLRTALDSEWDAELALLYGLAHCEDLTEQLIHAEAWLGAHPEDAGLLLSCGRLALRNNDLNKARTFFEKAVALNGPLDAYRELGGLLEKLGEKDKALTYYRRGLEQSASDRHPSRRGSGMGARYRLVR